MRVVAPALIASLFTITTAIAAEPSALAPGKPAGLKSAQLGDVSPWVYGGVVLVGIGIALAVSSNGSSGPTMQTTAPTTTGSTG
jgi:hypothetical protein